MKKSLQLSFFQLLNGLAPYKIFIFLLIHSLLLVLSWHSQHTVFFVFLAFIPFFYFLDNIPKSYYEKVKLYIFSFFAVFFWIYFTIYWIKPINLKLHFFTTFISATILYIPYLLTYYFRFSLKKSSSVSKMIFISTWVLIELLHDLNILGFPYLNLGHILAAHPLIIQWYAWSGFIGGTIWILGINLCLNNFIFYLSTIEWNNRKQAVLRGLLLISIMVFPIILSFLLTTKTLNKDGTSFNAVCVHTNVDVFYYKYNVEPEILLEEYLTLTLDHIDSTQSNLIVWPENALTGNIFYNEPDSSLLVKKIKQKLCKNPGNVLITGAIVDEIVDKPDSNSYLPNVLYNSYEQYYFKRYNTALLISPYAPTLIKTKKRLVPFSEKVPTQKLFSPLVALLPNLANLNFSSIQDEYPVFSIETDSIRFSPVICYGSAFSDYFAEEVLKTQSNVGVVILNEGWMKSEKAYNHFNWFSVCRAIENQRQIIKSSNCGISALINRSGETKEIAIGASADVIVNKMHPNEDYSFFTRYHSQIYNGLLIFGLAFILIQLLIPIFFSPNNFKSN